MSAQNERPVIDLVLEAANRLGIRQNELARRAGLQESRITRWKQGIGEPSVPEAKALVDVVGMSLGEAVGEVPGGERQDEAKLVWRRELWELLGRMSGMVQRFEEACLKVELLSESPPKADGIATPRSVAPPAAAKRKA